MISVFAGQVPGRAVLGLAELYSLQKSVYQLTIDSLYSSRLINIIIIEIKCSLHYKRRT